MNSLPKTVTRQRRGCDLIPGPFAPESSTLTTRLPSHPFHYYTNTKPGNTLTSVWTAENMLDSRHIRVRINCVRGRDPRKSGVVRWKSVMARGSRSAPPAYFLSGQIQHAAGTCRIASSSSNVVVMVSRHGCMVNTCCASTFLSLLQTQPPNKHSMTAAF